MMPHDRSPQRVNLSSELDKRDKRFNQKADYHINHDKYSNNISQSTHKNWRFQGSANDDIQEKSVVILFQEETIRFIDYPL